LDDYSGATVPEFNRLPHLTMMQGRNIASIWRREQVAMIEGHDDDPFARREAD
jgi:hypothetical protein